MLLVTVTKQDAVLKTRTRLKERIPFLPTSTLTPIWSWGLGTVHQSPKIPSHPLKTSQFETDLRRIKNKIMWSACLIKNLAWKTEMNIEALSPCCEKDTHLLTFSTEKLLRTWLTPVSVDFSYFSWRFRRKSDALLFSLPLSVRSVVWTVSSSKLSFKGIIKQY